MQENSLFGPFYETQAQKHRGKKKQNHQKTKNRPKKTAFCILANNPLFLVDFCFFQVTLFHVCKAVFCCKHFKNSFFSRARLLGITDSKAPFRGPFPKWHFCNQKCHFGFSPLPAETPVFVVFGDLNGHQEKDHFPKTEMKMRLVWHLPNTNSVYLFF